MPTLPVYCVMKNHVILMHTWAAFQLDHSPEYSSPKKTDLSVHHAHVFVLTLLKELTQTRVKTPGLKGGKNVTSHSKNWAFVWHDVTFSRCPQLYQQINKLSKNPVSNSKQKPFVMQNYVCFLAKGFCTLQLTMDRPLFIFPFAMQ